MRWSNWAGNQTCAPSAVVTPRDEDELAAAVKEAAAAGRRVKAVGAGHSFTGAALTDGTQVRPDAFGRVLAAEEATGLVTVQAGITLRALSRELAERGLA